MITTPALRPQLTPEIGSDLLGELGFLHVPGPPLTASRAYLFVALRPSPTRQHFDPERIEHWVAVDAAGQPAEIGRTVARRLDGTFAWGSIRINDRLGIWNDYTGFGGHLSVDIVDGVTVAVFSSEAPILARGGHSQGWDPLADKTTGYVARLRAAVGRSRQLEALALSLAPLALYSAFVIDTLEREQVSSQLIGRDSASLLLLRREARRLSAEHPADWSAGRALTGAVEEARQAL